ncbi:hypothetical protein GCM10008955_00420 [Deinococcus malanensis]|uniref:SpoVT-AbrB domain-containing protein n=1 Tax=Deinococcus malanensis TaxID=1706855 RepID=A0ABQ2EH17_9DEIO|nr:hypothetical protein GCM10008955_00420 [Deinococcus malanensis]
MTQQHEVKAGGRVPLPAELRQHLQLTTGSRLIIRVQDAGHAELVTSAALAAELRGLLKDDGPSLSDELTTERHEEARRENLE